MKDKKGANQPGSAGPRTPGHRFSSVLPGKAAGADDAKAMISSVTINSRTGARNQAAEAKGTAPRKGEGVINVAVVEDHEWVRNSLAAQIDNCALLHCVSRHRTGEEALRHLPALQPDVVLMDINLPGINGIECVRRLKEDLPAVNILMLTVYEETEKIFDSLKAGASGYLLKQTSTKELIEAITDVHAGSSPMTGVIARKVVRFFEQKGHSPPELEVLTPRESEVLELLGEGAAYKEIADALGLSISTVRMHICGIYRKLHVHSRGEVVAKYLRR
jgi:DNA-binding NarL/FixJ family response regulator